ncbi:PAS domain-containing protein [Mesorhizobium sp. A556]
MANPRRTDSIQSEFSYEDFIDNGIVALHVVGPDGVIQCANKAELELLGYGADEYIGHHLADFYSDRHVLDEILTRLKRGENIYRRYCKLNFLCSRIGLAGGVQAAWSRATSFHMRIAASRSSR